MFMRREETRKPEKLSNIQSVILLRWEAWHDALVIICSLKRGSMAMIKRSLILILWYWLCSKRSVSYYSATVSVFFGLYRPFARCLDRRLCRRSSDWLMGTSTQRIHTLISYNQQAASDESVLWMCQLRALSSEANCLGLYRLFNCQVSDFILDVSLNHRWMCAGRDSLHRKP